MIDLNYAKEAFEKYMTQFDLSDKKIELKYIHTLEVMKTTHYLCTHEKLNKEDQQLALLIALLHDIGRFEQVKQFHSFNDQNIDHGQLGVKVLFEDHLIESFITDRQYDDIICQAITYHSVYKIPKIEDSRVLLHIKLIRDSDKLDNFRVKNTVSIKTLFDIDEYQFYNQRVSKNILNDIKNHRLILKENRHNEVDMWVSYFAFVFDFYFQSSYQFLIDNDYISSNMNRFDFKDGLREDMMFVKEECESFIQQQLKKT